MSQWRTTIEYGPGLAPPNEENTASTDVVFSPLPVDTVFAVMNRLLRPQFPVGRDRQQMIQFVSKGLTSPQIPKARLDELPIRTLETLFQQLLYVSAAAIMDNEPGEQTKFSPNMLDGCLSLIWIIESLIQFNPWSLVYEDLAVLQFQSQEGLQAHHYSKPLTKTGLTAVLNHHGFSASWLDNVDEASAPAKEGEEDITLAKQYWLSRKLSVVLPWMPVIQAFEKHMDSHPDVASRYPYLNRFLMFAEGLSELMDWMTQMELMADNSSADWGQLRMATGQIEELLLLEGPLFAQAAQVPVPMQLLVLVEGSSEEIIIPAVARCMGIDLNYEGIMVESVGGKNQMLTTYVHRSEQLACPICMILDKDAQDFVSDIDHYRRDSDEVFLIEQGELEDLYPVDAIVRTFNTIYTPHPPLETLDYQAIRAEIEGSSQIAVINHIFQSYGWGPFDKVKFATQLSENFTSDQDISSGLRDLVEQMLSVKQTSVSSSSLYD